MTMVMTAVTPTSVVANPLTHVPPTQNTAPVLEFRCLYTQDLRRKQKRWQDGRLRYHTFNKRIMVYDERSNFVGDTHWREDCELAEGEELELERGSILVEVGECIGKKEQDLSELVDKRVKERKERLATKLAAAPSVRNWGTPGRPNQLPQKPLNAVLAPTGHYGRAAVPNTSPFEERQRNINVSQDDKDHGPPAKRRKQSDTPSSRGGYAQNLMGATLALAASMPQSTASIRHEPLRIKVSGRHTPAETIDLTMDINEGSKNLRTIQTTAREGRDAGEPSMKVQRKPKRSPVRTGYASNLTGATLTFSRPDSVTLRPTSNAHLAKHPHTHEVPDRNELFVTSQGVSPTDTDLSNSSVTSPRQKDAISVTTKVVNLISTSRQSSPPRIAGKATPLVKLKRSEPVATSPSSVPDGRTTELPTSALRIKSRSRRKMMMLMNGPRPRTNEINAKSPSGGGAVLNEIVFSQATMHLNSFAERQEARLQERLNRKHPRPDRQKPSSSINNDDAHHVKIQQLETKVSGQSSSNNSQSEVAENGLHDQLRSEDGEASSKANTNGNNPQPVPGVVAVEVSNMQSILKSSPNRHSGDGIACSAPSSIKNSACDSLTEVSRSPRRATRISEHASIAIQAPKDPLRDETEISSGSPGRLVAHYNPRTLQIDRNEPFPSEAVCPRQSERPLDEAEVKLSPKPSPFVTEVLSTRTELCDEPRYKQEDRVMQTPDPRVASVPALKELIRGPSRARLANPATRGKSLQSLAATTTDSTTPTFNCILPRTCVTGRPERVHAGDRHDREGLTKVTFGGPVGERTVTGPWSHESFDLFGSWRPPGHSTTVNTTHSTGD